MEGFESIYDEYFPRVYFFIRKLCGDDLLSEELTQETFFRAYLSFYRFRGECGLFTWLASIAKNVWFSWLRRNGRAQLEIELAVTGDGGAEPEREISRRMAAAEVRRALAALPPKYRDVALLRVYAELPFSEIAAELGITENSARVVYHRAKELLKKTLISDPRE